ncbi:membrane protein containing DUF1538 [Sulfurimonas gotlandica GD1]|jgi:hypothetical protein|uniref:Membrane protein containing DUF1538 n=1 Tax=Sulfurimonas gotlandica (strain DSM 19862 / JCM 16533 / GD1) TaxID=929558 RepID=B6BHW3_SULGG|nr:DUF1538 domain-containing protein [Sulfurimonas gotlandica]EDZ63522.1 conserved hypothetical protein [Sulfurimonas gotlandica GD1]EHP30115.1 membrane protein containing DUF1538 [Sulfurimonas gotlandica GD1]
MQNLPPKQIRFGDYTRDVQANYTQISYNDITNQTSRQREEKIQLRSLDVYRLVKPYVSVRFMEQVYGLMPLAIYLVLFQIFMLRQSVTDASTISAGLFAVILGLMFFMEGIKQGLMPFGEIIGNTLPKKVSLSVVLLIAFLLGIGVTFAEPAIGALKAAGSLVEVQKAPYLYAMLNDYSNALVLIVGIGVGLAAVLGTMRFIYGWSLKPYIYISLIPTILLTIYVMFNSDLVSILGLAWDSGAVTTGPVTVPLVLALGIGIAAASGKGDSSLSGFGIVTLASIFPIIGVMSLGIYLSFIITPSEIIALAQSSGGVVETLAWYETTPGEEVVLGIRAIVPLVLFLLFVLKIVLKANVPNAGTIFYGIILAVLGMIIFNVGLTYGLAKLGSQSGSLIPAAFNTITTADGSIIDALYPYAIGLSVAILFAWILGFGATLAEPALNALGMTVENLTQGVFKKRTLMYAVSLGVGTGIALGIVKIIFNLPLGYIIIPLYSVAVLLTYMSDEAYVNIAWDSAGVTTGPITVPLVLAMGLGFGDAVGSIEGFGILSMASIGPIISVLITGLWVGQKRKKAIKENA